eukprot:1065844-Prorocentrum_minimum.AAC.3
MARLVAKAVHQVEIELKSLPRLTTRYPACPGRPCTASPRRMSHLQALPLLSPQGDCAKSAHLPVCAWGVPPTASGYGCTMRKASTAICPKTKP